MPVLVGTLPFSGSAGIGTADDTKNMLTTQDTKTQSEGPCFHLETDEDDVRLRGSFPPGAFRPTLQLICGARYPGRWQVKKPPARGGWGPAKVPANYKPQCYLGVGCEQRPLPIQLESLQQFVDSSGTYRRIDGPLGV